jgi:D-glycero-alpha-D-manno-heptose 1-phosphate guanylyltransferase
MEAIILAGGLGTRLRSRLNGLPKPMAPIVGRPFLEILLDQLIKSGCERIILSVGHLHHVIINQFRQSYHGVPIEYIIEETPLGTGGAIRFAMQKAVEHSVLVLNGDTYLDADFSAMLSLHIAAGSPITMAVTNVNDMARYGGIVIEGQQVVRFVEKGQVGSGWINAGVYAINRDFPWLEGLPSRFSFEMDVLARDLDRLCPTAFPCAGEFLDIGTPEDLDRAQERLLGQKSGN